MATQWLTMGKEGLQYLKEILIEMRKLRYEIEVLNEALLEPFEVFVDDPALSSGAGPDTVTAASTHGAVQGGGPSSG